MIASQEAIRIERGGEPELSLRRNSFRRESREKGLNLATLVNTILNSRKHSRGFGVGINQRPPMCGSVKLWLDLLPMTPHCRMKPLNSRMVGHSEAILEPALGVAGRPHPDKPYKKGSQEKYLTRGQIFSHFPARVNEQGWFCSSAPWTQFGAEPSSAVCGFSPSGFHRLVVTKPVRSETDKQNGCQVPTMVLSETHGLSLFPRGPRVL
jgi:hypothetical protein